MPLKFRIIPVMVQVSQDQNKQIWMYILPIFYKQLKHVGPVYCLYHL